jgi:hypothetical membrane protein
MYATIPLVHLAAFGVLLRRNGARQKAFAAGFLCAFWILAGAYLLFIGVFLFSSETRHPRWQRAWFESFAIALWMVVASAVCRRADGNSFSIGAVASAIFAVAFPTLFALARRNH